MAKRTTSQAGQKKRTSKSAASSAKSKSAVKKKTKKASGDASTKKKAVKSTAAKKTKKAVKRAARESSPKVKAAPAAPAKKRGLNKGNNRLLPKIPVKAVESKKPTKLRKTHLRPDELKEFRHLLLEKRANLAGDIAHLQSEVLHQGSSGEPSRDSMMPIHMADIGSDTWEQELTLGLIENEQSLIREINEALDRIDNNTYGICLATNKPITKSRLRARPWAKYCIEYARKRELGLA